MPARLKQFTILDLCDLEKSGFNEATLPLLITIMDSATPDYRLFNHLGVMGYFVSSSASLDRIEQAVQSAESLRDSDDRFSNLGIGIGAGPMITDCQWWGALKPSGLQPIGQPPNDASKCSRQPGLYREKLKALKEGRHS